VVRTGDETHAYGFLVGKSEEKDTIWKTYA